MELPEHALILANDVVDYEKAIKISEEVAEHVDAIKIGWPLTLAGGLNVFKEIKKRTNLPLIADWKIADIGHKNKEGKWEGTNAKIMEHAMGAGADYVICHTIIGTSSIQECVDVAKEHGGNVLTLAYMTHKGANVFFDQPIDIESTQKWLDELGYNKTAEAIDYLDNRKSMETNWRLDYVSVSDLILEMGEDVKVSGYIGPANLPDVLKDYRKITAKKTCTPGIGRQKRQEDKPTEAQIGDVYNICSDCGFIVGSGIYKAENPGEAAKEFKGYRDIAIGRKVDKAPYADAGGRV